MKGILFKPDMHLAIIEGRKTVTRRVMKPQPKLAITDEQFKSNVKFMSPMSFKTLGQRYTIGEVIYIKEAIHRFNVEYASYDLDFTPVMFLLSANRFHWHWKRDKLSPMFLPREAARHFIQITGVRHERLQEITEEDALREGFNVRPGITSGGSIGLMSALACFKEKWDSINPEYPWASNPFVWPYEFKKVERPQ